MDVEKTLIPALAILATTVMSIATLWHQRRSSEQARLWERRTQLYVDLLANQHPYLAESDMDPAIRSYFGPQTCEERELLESLSARADAFATEPVARLWRDAVFRVHVVSTFVTEGMGDPRSPTPEERTEIAPLLEQRAAASDALRKQIRTDLKTYSRRRSLWGRRSRALPDG
ncbi:hypothetical protein [Streptomyces sp. NBC_00273]|uniref:hypothetical protein n=1 Tax=Streptomyces sp. NBC_00273 TaxID=2903644 RepID=UPI002E2D6911|nr:hypothetical protein [Streptomyces sp. NBC_00273]